MEGASIIKGLRIPIARPGALSLPWKKILLLDLLLLSFLILGTRLATLVHEILGHALFSLLTGGAVKGIRISLFGGGNVYHALPDGAGVPSLFAVALSGIALNLVTGAAVILRPWKSENPKIGHALWILFGLASLLGGLAYGALGFYYGEGDPVDWMSGPGYPSAWFCVPFLAAAPFSAFAAVDAYLKWMEGWLPGGRSGIQRLGLVAATLGIALASYAGFYTLSGAESRAMDAPRAAAQRAVEEAERQELAALIREVQKRYPGLTDDQARDLIGRLAVQGPPVEVPRKFPLKIVLACLFSMGGLCAVFRPRQPGRDVGEGSLSPRSVLAVTAVAASVLAVLGLTGGWIFRSG